MKRCEHESLQTLDTAERPGRMAYWLIPAAAERKWWQPVIDMLAKRYRSVSFDPHVTLYHGPFSVTDRPETLLRTATKGTSSLQLNVTGLMFSDAFTKSCYLQFQPDAQVRKIHDTLKGAVGEPAEYAVDPHLSLFYGKLEESDRLEIMDLMAPIMRKSVLFDAVWAVASAPGTARTSSAKDVERWRLVTEVSFESSGEE